MPSGPYAWGRVGPCTRPHGAGVELSHGAAHGRARGRPRAAPGNRAPIEPARHTRHARHTARQNARHTGPRGR